MANGTLDTENSAVHEALALLFKAEAGVEYTNEEPVMPEENFNYQQPTGLGENLTETILTNIDDLYAESG